MGSVYLVKAKEVYLCLPSLQWEKLQLGAGAQCQDPADFCSRCGVGLSLEEKCCCLARLCAALLEVSFLSLSQLVYL